MKLLAIVGSRRKKGNTSILVQEALKPFSMEGIETELIFLGDYDIRDCNGCEACKDTYKCIVDDDMQKLYPAILESDAIILGSPAYFYNITADMKAFIDRCYCFEVFDKDDRSVWMGLNEALGVKYAAVIAVSEQEKEEDMGFTAEAMVKPLEALGYRVVSTVKTLHLYKAGEALKSEKALQNAKQAGEKLLKTLQLKKEVKTKLSENHL
ncbi:NADPH-dependent FMN reductase [Candidatus Syntrophocurvum alkaliphilum]|uniref:NADPH-dependent FMN reductase n=1 Tax=Candidatus Syntrophocurvum alkaliphilum TaxID=2293317 RepID=A0A6I6DDJ7_9FIRM|nr:flavodoxin family protein [Candidatus Syntrophocurvum alkaliphilum]QGT99346.1 NADPH-dependent FMN reductase [Candidatus Syntrophocurvum alkaliphilum]